MVLNFLLEKKVRSAKRYYGYKVEFSDRENSVKIICPDNDEEINT